MKIPISEIQHLILNEKKLKLSILRLDEIHSEWGGNKYFKLKYNIENAKSLQHSTVLSFGGAYSNHIAALAAIGYANKIKTIGVIRGEKSEKISHTLKLAEQYGMNLMHVSREDYKKKDSEEFLNKLKNYFGDFYLIPEGGSNTLGIKGCTEILEGLPFDVVCCACGTGATLAGLAISLKENQSAIGFSSLKGGHFLEENVANFIKNYPSKSLGFIEKNWELMYDYHFGGYGKVNAELLAFKQNFEEQNDIELDFIYTAKMMKGIMDLMERDYFKPGTQILAIHSGGLQGNKGFNL